jgi:hypothetical protein
MTTPRNTESRLLLRSAVELAAVTLLVFATGRAGVRLAEHVHRHPVRPGPGGIIELRIVKSDRRGEVSFEEGPGYAGWWHCVGKDWAVEWRFAPEPARRYSVGVRVASPEHLPEARIAVAVGDHVLEAIVPDTGGPAKWKTLNLGQVVLDGTPCTLTVRPGASGLTNLNLKSATLRPVESSLQQ